MKLIDEILSAAQPGSAPLSRSWVESAGREAPYLWVPLLLYLKQAKGDAEANEALLRRLAILAPDRKALSLQLGDDVKMAGIEGTSLGFACIQARLVVVGKEAEAVNADEGTAERLLLAVGLGL